MVAAERAREGVRIVDSSILRQAHSLHAKNDEYVADTLWESGHLTRITRPTVHQSKKERISFFASVEVSGVERKIPVVVRTSGGAAQEYRDENLKNIRRKGIIILVARNDMEPKAILDNFKECLSRYLKIQLPKRAGVAELVNAPV